MQSFEPFLSSKNFFLRTSLKSDDWCTISSFHVSALIEKTHDIYSVTVQMLMYLEGVMKLSPIIVNVLGPTPCTVTVDSQLMRYKRRRNLEVRMVGSGRNQGRTCGPEDLGLRPLAGLIHSIQPDVLCSTLSRFPPELQAPSSAGSLCSLLPHPPHKF